MTLSIAEFIGRWCDHSQPDQLTKTRYFGGWCNQHRDKYLARCRQLQGVSAPPPVANEPEPLPLPACCSQCEQPTLRLVGETPKPSWRDVLSHLDPRCPDWYADCSKAALSRYLEATYGIGYEDWCLEMGHESAMSQAGPAVPSPAVQLYLPGLHPERDFALESY